MSHVLEEITGMVKEVIVFESNAEYENADRLHNEINAMISLIYSNN